jgi:transaldolase
MKFFLDTANIKEIREGQAMGVLDGVTTNPSLAAKEGRPFKELIMEICDTVDGPISVEVTATDLDGMLEQGRNYAKWHRNVVVKLPTTIDGVKGLKTLTGEGIKVNMTLCFSPTQALIVAKAGATYVSPFVGRLDDISANGMTAVREIVQIYNNYGFKTQVLAASLRHPMHIVEAALAGAHVGTMPFKVLEMLFHHPLTDIGLEKFSKDWEKANMKDLQKAMR